jgi:mercuric ion transport protein
VTTRAAERVRWWRVLPAGLAGLACAACCAVPVLITAGLLAGGGVVGAMLGWLPGAAVALVVVAVVAFLLPARRKHLGGCAGGTGCSSCATEVRDLPGERSTLAP